MHLHKKNLTAICDQKSYIWKTDIWGRVVYVRTACARSAFARTSACTLPYIRTSDRILRARAVCQGYIWATSRISGPEVVCEDPWKQVVHLSLVWGRISGMPAEEALSAPAVLDAQCLRQPLG